jgi:hypothetical protein
VGHEQNGTSHSHSNSFELGCGFFAQLPTSAHRRTRRHKERSQNAAPFGLRSWLYRLLVILAPEGFEQNDQPSSRFKQICCGGRRRGGPVRRDSISLQQASEFHSHYLEYSRTHVCARLLFTRLRTAVLHGVPPKYGEWRPF